MTVHPVVGRLVVRRARDKFDLLRFDASGAVSSNMFDEEWASQSGCAAQIA